MPSTVPVPRGIAGEAGVGVIWDCPTCQTSWTRTALSAVPPQCKECGEAICDRCLMDRCHGCRAKMHSSCGRRRHENVYCRACMRTALVEEFKDASLVVQLEQSREAALAGLLGPKRKVG